MGVGHYFLLNRDSWQAGVIALNTVIEQAHSPSESHISPGISGKTQEAVIGVGEK